MIGVSQANRLLHFIAILKERGARELADRRTAGSRCFTNPFGKAPDAAPYIFITKKATIKFGHTLVGASMMSEARVDDIMSGRI